MVDELISLFKKSDLERKMFFIYFVVAAFSIIVYVLFYNFFNLRVLNYTIFLVIIIFVELLSLYTYIYFIDKKILEKKLKFFDFKTNIALFGKSEQILARNTVISFLKLNKIYRRDCVLFFIETIRCIKKPRYQRDWFSLTLTTMLTILVASIREGNIDLNILTMLLYCVIIAIVVYVIYHFFRFGYNGLSSNSSLSKLEGELSDIYLTMK